MADVVEELLPSYRKVRDAHNKVLRDIADVQHDLNGLVVEDGWSEHGLVTLALHPPCKPPPSLPGPPRTGRGKAFHERGKISYLPRSVSLEAPEQLEPEGGGDGGRGRRGCGGG